MPVIDRRRHRGGRVAGRPWLSRGRLPRAAAAGLLMLAPRRRGDRARRPHRRRDREPDERPQRPPAVGSERRSRAGCRTSGSARRARGARRSDAHSSSTSVVQALLDGVADGDQGAVVAGVLPRADRAQPVLPAQGRPDHPSMGRAPHGRARTRGPHHSASRVLQSLRGYFLGVTIVAVFNAVVVGVGALVLGVPMAGTIAAHHVRRRLHPVPRAPGAPARSRC